MNFGSLFFLPSTSSPSSPSSPSHSAASGNPGGTTFNHLSSGSNPTNVSGSGGSNLSGNPDSGGNPNVEAIILFPALGFPAIIEESSRKLTCVLLVKKDFDTSSDHLRQQLRLQKWSDRNNIRNEITFGSNVSISVLNEIPVEQILNKGGLLQPFSVEQTLKVLRLAGLGEKSRLSSKLIRTYREKGFNRIVIVTLDLPNSVAVGMYHIFLVGRKESEFVREIIRELMGPFDEGLLDPNRATKTARGADIELFHPIQVANASYLNIAHVTDTHLAFRWELMKRRIGNNQHLLDHFNNPNERFKETFDLINKDNDIHLTILSGDLIDYNRGHSGKDSNDIDDDYLFNRNWLLIYEALMEKYEKPVFTTLGNHDWRLNPYAPSPQLGWDNFFSLLLLIAFPLVISGAGAGALEGLTVGLFNKENKDGWEIPVGILLMLVAIGWTPAMFFLFILFLESQTGTGQQPTLGGWFIAAGLIVSCVLLPLLPLWLRDAESGGEGALAGMKLGAISGLILEVLVLILLLIGVLIRAGIRYVHGIVNLTESETKELIPEDFNDLDLLGKDGIFVNTEDAIFWYSLIINPFLDYSFQYKNMSFLMLDFNEGEDLIHSMPPNPANSLSTGQWQMIQDWLTRATPTTVPILAMHATAFSPLSKIALHDLVTRGIDYLNEDLNEGAILWHRETFINYVQKLENNRQIAPIILSGHTHVNDIFQVEGALLRKKLTDPTEPNKFNPNSSLFITTICNGPIGDRDEEKHRKVAPGFRIIKFNNQGKVDSLDEIHLPRALQIMEARMIY